MSKNPKPPPEPSPRTNELPPGTANITFEIAEDLDRQIRNLAAQSHVKPSEYIRRVLIESTKNIYTVTRKIVTVNMSEELVEEIDKLAKKSKSTRSEYIRRILTNALEQGLFYKITRQPEPISSIPVYGGGEPLESSASILNDGRRTQESEPKLQADEPIGVTAEHSLDALKRAKEKQGPLIRVRKRRGV